jgi:hypothetical protein
MLTHIGASTTKLMAEVDNAKVVLAAGLAEWSLREAVMYVARPRLASVARLERPRAPRWSNRSIVSVKSGW